MIRITGGKFRGRTIESPSRRKEIRPTTSMMRESIFNRLQTEISGARFLDLFAGSGIMGLEALSRGTAFVLAVEQDKTQCRLMRENVHKLGVDDPSQYKVVPLSVQELLSHPCREEGFDIVFMDPPYGLVDLQMIINLLKQNGWVKTGATMIVEHGKRDADLPGFTRKEFGDTSISMGSAL